MRSIRSAKRSVLAAMLFLPGFVAAQDKGVALAPGASFRATTALGEQVSCLAINGKIIPGTVLDERFLPMSDTSKVLKVSTKVLPRSTARTAIQGFQKRLRAAANACRKQVSVKSLKLPSISKIPPKRKESEAIVVKGKNLDRTLNVYFDEIAVRFTIVSPTEFSVVLPAGIAQGRLSIAADDGSYLSPVAYSIQGAQRLGASTNFNSKNPCDVDGADGCTARDRELALQAIATGAVTAPYLNANNDGAFTISDVLRVTNAVAP